MEWHASEEGDGWRGVGSELIFLATGLCGVSLIVTSWVCSLVGLGSDRSDPTTDYPDFDL
jgi:hypothetical protein